MKTNSSQPKKKTKVYNSVWCDRLVACIGFEATRKLITAYGGQTIKVPMAPVFFQLYRNFRITQDFCSLGYTRRELEQKWGLSYKTISNIVKQTQYDPRFINWLRENE